MIRNALRRRIRAKTTAHRITAHLPAAGVVYCIVNQSCSETTPCGATQSFARTANTTISPPSFRYSHSIVPGGFDV